MVDRPNLAVSHDELTRLAGDLDDMQRHLDSQVRRMDAVVDRIEARWKGEAAKGYRALHRGAAEDAVRVREILQVLEEAVRMGRDGFTEQELDALRAMRTAESKVDVVREARELSEGTAPTPPRSRINDI
ncbi:WXG100 family type VII secretion target [Streptomyces sp. NPDC058220]|uniref:WXG100 family type VII secretion target n=1 Tax=Streptomyces sp. NPDC058220 TaxID=3346387 RepID=UPI0036E27DB3